VVSTRWLRINRLTGFTRDFALLPMPASQETSAPQSKMKNLASQMRFFSPSRVKYVRVETMNNNWIYISSLGTATALAATTLIELPPPEQVEQRSYDAAASIEPTMATISGAYVVVKPLYHHSGEYPTFR
jgi:hypothetical protein